eukprot:scaffold405579_cov26-Prasinocladus_malaysianus.AAC.1
MPFRKPFEWQKAAKKISQRTVTDTSLLLYNHCLAILIDNTLSSAMSSMMATQKILKQTQATLFLLRSKSSRNGLSTNTIIGGQSNQVCQWPFLLFKSQVSFTSWALKK